jgi:hypothetical protein
MAGVYATFCTAEVALGASVAKTVMQLYNANNHRAKITAYGFSFDGVSGTAEPVVCELLRQTSAGTMFSLAATKVNANDPETVQTVGQHTATAEPTGTTAIKRFEVHPQGGYEWTAPFGQEIIMSGSAASYVGFRCTAPANVNVVCNATVEE